MPKSVADTTTKFVFTKFLSVLNRNTNITCSTGLDTGTTASPHCILFARQLTTPACSHVPTKIKHKHVAGTAHHKHCTEPWRNDISNFCPLARSFHTVLTSSAASEPQSHGAFSAVASCSVPRSCRRDVMALCTSSQRSVCNSELSQIQFGSDTVPHQLENNPRAIPATQTCINFLLQTTKISQKPQRMLHHKLTTPTLQTTL